MSPPLRLAAPAKLNLGLRVVGRRADGYHELESVFAPLDLADALALRWSEADVARVTLRAVGGPPVPEGSENLAVRAAEAFLRETDQRLAIEIELEKRIPTGGGLGGGSSDAGTVLRALAEHHPGALSRERLAALALELGADVPFFLDPRPAWVRGIGERIAPLAGLPALPVLLVNPGVELSTASVFRSFDALGEPPSPPAAKVPDFSGGDAGAAALAPLLHNDLEPAAIRLLPELRRLRERLRALGGIATGMSGSGPTLFSVFESREQAEVARGRADFPGPVWTRVASTRESG